MAEAAKKTAASKPEGAKRERKPLATLDVKSIQVTAVNDAETMRKHRHERTERGADQRAIDDLVRQAHERWVNAGRPENWMESTTGYTLKVPEGQYDLLKAKIQKSGTYFNVAIRFGKRQESSGGYAELLFIAKDRAPKQEKTDGDEAASR